MHRNPLQRFLNPRSFLVLVPFFVAWSAVAGAQAPEVDVEHFFEERVRPVLIEHCTTCHGSKKQESGLRVDSLSALLAGGDSGPAIVPGAVELSRLVQAIRHRDGLEMPPDGRLVQRDIEAIEKWIELGAYWPSEPPPDEALRRAAASQHWAFQPVARPEIPVHVSDPWVRGPIDAFVLEKLRSGGLDHAPEADRATLIRRATYAVTGLPPSASAVAAFTTDLRPDAYERLVEDLLESPQYGEKWARHWLDVARYSDTKGYVYAREERFWTHAWTYRDWVVEALNRDVPYDRFLLLQLAADQVPGAQPNDLAAMGFLTLGRRFLGVQRHIIDDRIDVVCRGTMGLTVSCARCHDHKYDPIPTDDYYSLYGVMDSCVEQQTILDASQVDDNFGGELRKRQDALQHKLQDSVEESSTRALQRLGDYLFAQTELHKYPADGFDQVFEATDLLPAFVRKWESTLRQAKLRRDPVFSLWHAYRELPEDIFANEATTVLPQLLTNQVAIHPRIARAFVEPPSSMRDVCNRYGQVFAEVAQAADGAESTEVPADERDLLDVLSSASGPCRVPDGPISYSEFFFDSATLTELWKLQGEVDRWLVNSPAPVSVAVALVDQKQPLEPRVFRRGDPLKLGEDVPRQFLEILSGEERQPFTRGSGRLELAQAIIDPTNPLTARVMVNRIWNHHFGTGLVDTPSDFGIRAESPSHPELLDWLANYFIEAGWSQKSLHREILLSATFRQSSAPPTDEGLLQRALATDPNARLLWRMPPRRLSFEELRDSLLHTTGDLNLRTGGKPQDIFAQPFPTRRTLYGLVDRQYFPSALRAFDFANPDLHIAQRSETTVPQQALFLLNHPFILQQARRLAAMSKDVPRSTDRIQKLFELVYQRDADQDELSEALNLLESATVDLSSAPLQTASDWSYGYGAFSQDEQPVVRFDPLPHFTGTAYQGGSTWPDTTLGWVQLTAEGGHPGNDQQHAAMRRWTAPRDMLVGIASRVTHEPSVGDGIRCSILQPIDGIVSSSVVHHEQVDLNVKSIQMLRGQSLDFTVDILDILNSDQYLWQIDIHDLQATDVDDSDASLPTHWNSSRDFPQQTTDSLDPWEQLAQVLLCSNEFIFLD